MAGWQHPLLGALHGKAGDGVVQYLGVKYASLKNKFSPPELCGKYEGGAIDATKLG